MDMFLRIDGIQGESQNDKHKGWVDIESYSWGAVQSTNLALGSGGGVGKVQYKDLTVTANLDKATPAISHFLSSGKHIPKVELSLCKAGGQQMEYYRITLENAMLTHVMHNAFHNSDSPKISYQFQAEQVKQSYWEQTTSGGKGAETQSGWNIKQNKAV